MKTNSAMNLYLARDNAVIKINAVYFDNRAEADNYNIKQTWERSINFKNTVFPQKICEKSVIVIVKIYCLL